MTDPYLDGRGVLRNLLGITDAKRLQQAEADFTKLRLFELEQGSVVSGVFDSYHLRVLHHHVFQDLYAWAGLTRGDEIELGGRRIVSPALLIKGQTKFETSPRVNASLEPASAGGSNAFGAAGRTTAAICSKTEAANGNCTISSPTRPGMFLMC